MLSGKIKQLFAPGQMVLHTNSFSMNVDYDNSRLKQVAKYCPKVKINQSEKAGKQYD